MSQRVMHLVRGSAFYGGPEIYILHVFAALDRQRYAPRLAVLAKDAAENVPICLEAEKLGLPHHFLSARSKFRWNNLRQLKDLIRSERIHVLHTHEYKSGLYGLLAAKSCGIPVVATAHGWTKNSLRARLYERLEALLLRRFNRVLVASEFMEKDLVRLGVPRDRIVRLPNAVDVQRFSLEGVTRAEARAKYLAGKETRLIGTVGRLSREKGHRYLLEALARIRGQMKNLKLMILGTGIEEPSLRRLSQRLGLEDTVKWIPSCPYAEIPLFFKAMDLFVLPSLRENQPLVLLEAMAAGTPVVATRVGGVTEMIRNGSEGLLVPPGNAGALAEAILQALSSEGPCPWVDKAARKVYTSFSLERFGTDINRVYMNIS